MKLMDVKFLLARNLDYVLNWHYVVSNILLGLAWYNAIRLRLSL